MLFCLRFIGFTRIGSPVLIVVVKVKDSCIDSGPELENLPDV